MRQAQNQENGCSRNFVTITEMGRVERFKDNRVDFRLSPVSLWMVIVTLCICPWLLVDGMTVVKYSALLIFASYLCFRLITKSSSRRDGQSELGKYFSAIFFLFPTISIMVFLINSHFRSQQFFGAYGRNTGLITYLALSLIAFYMFNNNREESGGEIFFGILVSGLLINIYFLFQYFGIDFAQWEDVYDVPSSFLGNPNFVSSFSGLTGSLSLLLLCNNRLISQIKFRKKERAIEKYRVVLFVFLVASSVTVLFLNGSAQGFLVFAVVFAIYGFQRFIIPVITLLRGRFGRIRKITFLLTSCVFLLFTIIYLESVLHPFQRADFQTRMRYWSAGVRVFRENWLNGIGFDAFGDYYLEFRRANDLGLGMYVNASHNVPLDFFINGGVFLGISYLITSLCVLFAFIRATQKKGNPLIRDVLLFSAWVGIQVQALISINQISIAFWNFVISGYFLSYLREMPNAEKAEKIISSKNLSYGMEGGKSKVFQNSSFTLFRPVGLRLLAIIFVISSALPLSSDFRFRESIYSQNLNTIEKAAKIFPTNGSRLIYAANILCVNGDSEGARRLVTYAVKQNPREVEAWRYLFRLPKRGNTYEEALRQLVSLDPEQGLWRSPLTDVLSRPENRPCLPS